MFSNNFPSFLVSENRVYQLSLFPGGLKNEKLQNSPWTPFFVQMGRSETGSEVLNVFEISEIPVEEVGIKNNDVDTTMAASDALEEMCVEESSPESTGILDQVLQDQLLKLKEMLLDIKKGYSPHQCCPEVAIFNSISPCQVPAVCEILELSTLSDVAVAVVLNSLSLLEPAISLITAASVIHHAIHCRMKNWTSDSSRVLTTGILMFTKKYPKAVIDELILPLMKDESFDTPEILQDIIKDGLPDDQVLYCLRECLEISNPNENTVTAVRCLIEGKVLLDASLCHTLTEKICSWSTAFNSSVKFCRLLKSLISFHGSQMSEEQLSTLSVVVQNNTTFLKTSVANLLKKLCVKHVKST